MPRRRARRWLVLAAAVAIVAVAVTWRSGWPGGAEPEEALDPAPAVASLADGTETFRFATIGDYGTGSDAARRVASQVRRWAQQEHASALVTTGDNVYPDGDPDRFRAAWWEPYGWVDRQGVRVIASLGNHDSDNGGRDVMELLDMPARWYEVGLGDADVFVLDANRPTDPEQLAWLEQVLARSQARWKIAVFHQPAFSCSTHATTADVVAGWVPLFENYGVDLVLNGHDHNYQRFQVRHGVTYIVTGGSGAGLYEIEVCEHGEPPLVAGNDDTHSFVAVEGSATALHIQAISETGEVLDQIVLRD